MSKRANLERLLRTVHCDPRLPANVCISGGARGSDRAWGDAAAGVGHRVIHWLAVEPHAASPLDRSQCVILPEPILHRADPYLVHANGALNRTWPTRNDYANGLLRRDVYQALFAERVYAISTLDSAGLIKGGTAWAVQVWLDLNPRGELWFLDQDELTWWGWRNGAWHSLDQRHPPPPVGLWAGIGTTKLSEEVAAALPRLLAGRLSGQLQR